MMRKGKAAKRALAWIMLVVMGVNCFGDVVPASLSGVHAADYERASEEAEEVIRKAEQEAGIEQADEEDKGEEQETEQTTGQTAEQTDEQTVEQSVEQTVEKEENVYEAQENGAEEEEAASYEDLTISSETKMTQDMEVGNLTVNSKLHLNGHCLIVHGNITLNSYLYMEEGYVRVDGSFQELYNANIYMTSPNDCIDVSGDYIYNSSYYVGRTLKQGTVKIGGNISGKDGNDYCRDSVLFDSSCKVILDGSGVQKIDIRTDSNFCIKNLSIENTSEEGILSDHILNCDSIRDEQAKLHYKAEGEFGETLTEDKVIEGDYCLLGGVLDLAGYSLTVKGDFIHAGGKLLINGGSLRIEGNYRKQFRYMEDGKEISECSAGSLIMKNEKDYVLIEGDYIDSGWRTTEGELTAGVLELKGSMLADDKLNHQLFCAKGSHQMRFTGSGRQEIQKGKLFLGNRIQFAGLSVDQTGSGSLEWDSDIAVTESIEHCSGNISGLTRLEGAKIVTPDLYGDIRIDKEYSFDKDVEIHGNLYLAGNTSFVNCHVLVSGTFNQGEMEMKFTGEKAVLTVMGDYVLENSDKHAVNSGVVRIAGNLKKNGSAFLSFGEGAQLEFIGKKTQKVSVPHINTVLTNVIVDNPEGVIVEDNIAVINVSCRQGVLSYASGGVHGFTVEEDGEYDGDLIIGGGVFDLNGHNYRIKGNLTISNGSLNMTNEKDHLIVEGDFATASTLNHTGKLTNGIMEVKGNFTQTGGANAFTAGSGHKVVFNGTKQQEVSLASPTTCCFGGLELANTAGVVFASDVKAIGKVEQKGDVEGVLGISNTTTFEGNSYCGDVKLTEDVTLAENFKIDGNLLIGKELNLNGKTLEISGNVTLASKLYFQKGRLVCNFFDMQYKSSVYMQYEEDRLSIKKDWIDSRVDNIRFDKGNITVGGNITFGQYTPININEDVLLELNGTGKQTITMYGNVQSFGTLVLTNKSGDGIYVANDLNYKKIDNTSGTKVTFADGGILGYTLQKDEVVEGDLKLSGGELNLNGHNLTVRGDLLQTGGYIRVNGGTLLAEGDYCLAKRVKKEDGTVSYENCAGKFYLENEKDCITVKGNLYTAVSDSGWSCNAGTLKLAGDLIVSPNTVFVLNQGAALVLNGLGQQHVSFTGKDIMLGGLYVENAKGVAFPEDTGAHIRGDLCANGYSVDGLLYIYNSSVIKDSIVRSSLLFKSYTMNQDLSVEGEVNLNGLYLNGFHLTVDGNCTLNYRDNYGKINQDSGILEIKGNLLYNGGKSYYQGTGTNQVILSGNKKQVIQDNNMAWSFKELVIKNTSKEGVYAEGLFDAEKITDEDHKLSFYTEGEIGYTLKRDTVIQGDFNLIAGKLDLNGHKLTVTGNLHQKNGVLDINSGTLELYGDYILGNPDGKGGWLSTHANLRMGEEGYLLCGGDMVLVPYMDLNELKAGTMELKGDFDYKSPNNSIRMEKDLTVRFTGSESQKIISNGHESSIWPGTISLENTSSEGVVIQGGLNITNPVKGNGKINGTKETTVRWWNTETFPFTKWTGNLTLDADTVLSNDVAVDGTLTLNRNLDVNGKHLTVENLDINSGLSIHGGIAQIKNDVVLDSTSSKLYMQQPEDTVQVTGNLNAAAGTMDLSAGNLEVKGNFTLNGNCTLKAGEKHKTTLSGKMNSHGESYTQTVTIKEGVKLSTLVLTKPRDYYIFNRNAEEMCGSLVDDIQDITAPSVPGGLSAANISHTRLTLTWQASTDDTGVTGYDVYRNDKKVMSVSGTSYTDRNLEPGTGYSYYVIAKDAAFNTSGASDTLNVNTPEDKEAPRITGAPQLAGRMGTALKLRWNAAADNVKAAGYHIYRNGEEIGTTGRTEYLDTGLDVNSHYTYSISAYDGSGNVSERSEETDFYTQAVEIGSMEPAGYAKLSGRKTELKVSFANAGSVSGYHVYIGYREPEEEAYTQIYSKTAGKGTAYRRQITVSAELETAGIKSEEIEVVVRITDAGGYETEEAYTYYLDRSAPSKLSEAGIEMRDGVAVISYAKGKETDIAGYYIYREKEGDKREQIADITDADKTYYYDKTVEQGVSYTYYAAAYDEEGQVGELSDALKAVGSKDGSAPVITGVEPEEGILYNTAAITVNAEDNKALDKVIIDYLDDEEQAYKKLAECPFNGNAAAYELDTKKYGSEVTLRFTVLDGAGNENEEEFVKTYAIDNEGPEQIKNLAASVNSTTVILTWDAPSEEDFSHFSVEEQLEDGSWKEIAQTREVTGYAIEGLLPDSTHVYRVRAYDIRGNAGEPSEQVTAAIKEDTTAPAITGLSPNGGYYNKSIPLVVRGYDNVALAEMTIEYSTDRENWTLLSRSVFEEKKKEQTVSYNFDLSGIEEGDVYIRAYCKDTSGNEGNPEQRLLQCRVDKTAPAAVDKLNAEGVSGYIHLSWNEPVDNDVAGYRIYRSPEGVNAYTCIAAKVTSLGYYDRDTAYDASYSYRITAFDHAGNESGYSNAVSAQKLPDDEAPSVHSVLPEDGSWISGKVEVSVLVSDNDRVSYVEFDLKEQGENGTKQTAGMAEAGNGSGTVTCKINTEDYANGVYELLITAVDASGNRSKTFKSVLHISNVTLDKPELSAFAGNWCTTLHYSGMGDTSYILYKKKLNEDSFNTVISGTGSLMYQDNDVNPNYTYVYQLMIQDKAGNTAYSTLSYVKPKPVDDRKPKAYILSNTSVVEGYEVAFNGLDSTDNNKISSYRWDFGDNSRYVYGPAPRHVFTRAGEYNVTLTVEDPAGNTDYCTVKVTVLEKGKSGKAVVEVRNAAGTPLKGVTIYVNAASDKNETSYTDQYGKADIMQRPGTYRIAIYKPGYVATEKSVEIELHGERNYIFTLEQGETMSADFTVRQMTFEEITAAGIDLNDPANQHVFTVQTKLTFAETERPAEDTSFMVPAKAVVSSKRGNNTPNTPGGGGGGGIGGGGGGGGDTPAGEAEEFEDIYYYMYITQSISWLKDMYEASLVVYNNANSQTIVARDLSTKLVLPAGLSLAGTYSGQSAQKELKDLKGGESDSVSWYVRGDAPGKYKLQAQLLGKLMPFGADIACGFESNEFEVTAGDGLVLTINPEDRAEKGEAYYVYFTLSNEGSKEFYNVKTTFGTQHNNSKRYVAAADGSKRVPVMSAGDAVAVDCLRPGESISGIYKSSVPVKGEKWKFYKKLVDYECKVLEGGNLGVKVRISPVASHVPVPDTIYQQADDENSEADPVNVSTGAYTDSISALSVQGVNPVSADLSYDSTAAGEMGEFGCGWTHSYEARILDMKDCTVRYYVSPMGYYTFLAEDFEKAEYKQDGNGYLYIDEKSIPAKQDYRCLNDNKAGYELKRGSDRSFTLSDKAGTVIKFDKDGNLTSISNKEGKKITVERDDKGFTVADAAGRRKLSYSLNEDRLVESVKDGNGREAKFYYDENRRLKQFTNAMGENTYYTYDEGNRILTVTDNDNNTYVTNTYKEYDSALSPSGKVTRVESQKDALNRKTVFDYKEDEESGDTVTTVTTRSGKKKKTVTDAYGNITCVTNEAGDETFMTYDGDGNQTSVNNANGYDTVYKYDSNGNMTSIENSLMDGSLAETAMTYDSDGNMLTMKNAGGESMACTYYKNGLIETVKDQNGNTTHYAYNDNGQITEEKDAAGKTVKYVYNDRGDLVRVTDKNGNVTEYTYGKTGLQTGVTVKDGEQVYKTQTFYDDLGRVDYTIDTEGGITAYEYDCAGNVTSRTDPGGAMTVYAYDGNYQVVKETVYTSEDGKTVSSTTDYAYTKEGLLKKVADGKSGTVIENTYDEAGNKTRETEKDKNGKLLSDTRYSHDKAGNVTKETFVNTDPEEGEAESLSAEYNYYPNGKLNYAVDTAGNRTTYSYDKSWRVQTIVSDTEPSVTYKYDAAGRVISKTLGGKGGEVSKTSYTYDIYGNVKTVTDPAGHVTEYAYDGNGNQTEMKDVTGRVFYSRYDALNRVTEEGMRSPSAPEKDIPLAGTSYDISAHTVTRTDMVNGGSATTLYDAAGRPVKTTNKEGAVLSETVYDTEGRILQTVDAKGMVTENVYNSLMQVEKVRTGAKGAVSDGLYSLTGEIRETSYDYDSLGRNTKVTDAEEGVSSVVYDGLGRITSIKDPNMNRGGKASTYEYTYNGRGLVEKEKNAVGNVTEYLYNDSMLLSQMEDSAGEKTACRYDGLNRIKSVSDGIGTITYTYDANGNITEVTEKSGVIENLFGSGETIHREFDSLNRVTKYVDCNGHEVKYGYDELGNMVALTYPGGEIVRYTYHDDGNVKTMESSSGGTFTYGYDSCGRLNKIERADGSTETREYDAAGQLISQTDKDKDGNILQEHSYTYDVFGEMTTKSTSSAQNPGVLTTVTMTYDEANRLKTYNGEAVRYDEKGNMTYGPVDGRMQELAYDCRNRLVEAGGITYTYDAENTRTATTEDGVTTEYVTDTGGSLSRMLTAYEADNTETLYYYGAEGLAAQYNTGTNDYYAYHYDNTGSTTLITDRSGQAVERFSYGTYGELLKDAITKIRFLYNGSYGVATDRNGLYYMRARYYNPDIKRFINQDIKVGDIGSSQSLNRYAYCEGNPVNLVDPFGLSPQTSQDKGKESKYQWLHNALDWAGLFFDGADLVNGVLYAMEGDYVNAAISIACGIPAVGTVIAAAAKGTKAVKAAAKIADVCKAVGKAGNVAAGVKANYDTYMQARSEGKSAGEALAYTAGAMAAGLAAGTAANWAAKKVTNFAKANLPKMASSAKESAGKFVNKVSGAFRDSDGSDFAKASYYEYKALKQQGYSASEAYNLMNQFRSGNNPNNEFAFHFTTMKGGKGITDTNGIYASSSGVRGKGIYAGITPTPSWALKHIPYSGWGLGKAPVRIPIKLNNKMNINRLNVPIKSIKINADFLHFGEEIIN